MVKFSSNLIFFNRPSPLSTPTSEPPPLGRPTSLRVKAAEDALYLPFASTVTPSTTLSSPAREGTVEAGARGSESQTSFGRRPPEGSPPQATTLGRPGSSTDQAVPRGSPSRGPSSTTSQAPPRDLTPSTTTPRNLPWEMQTLPPPPPPRGEKRFLAKKTFPKAERGPKGEEPLPRPQSERSSAASSAKESSSEIRSRKESLIGKLIFDRNRN